MAIQHKTRTATRSIKKEQSARTNRSRNSLTAYTKVVKHLDKQFRDGAISYGCMQREKGEALGYALLGLNQYV